ncbi:MAG: SEL1-like repeat protein [Bacteroides sp.]|nr:SEL1-like repeat protein [Bacteroides sp.]
MYYKGEGMANKDSEKAYKWLEKASEQGHQKAKQFIEKNFQN